MINFHFFYSVVCFSIMMLIYLSFSNLPEANANASVPVFQCSKHNACLHCIIIQILTRSYLHTCESERDIILILPLNILQGNKNRKESEPAEERRGRDDAYGRALASEGIVLLFYGGCRRIRKHQLFTLSPL